MNASAIGLNVAVGLGQFDDVGVGRGVRLLAVENRDGLVDVGGGGDDKVALVVDDGVRRSGRRH